MQVGLKTGMTQEDKLGKAIALRAIAEKTNELEKKEALHPSNNRHLCRVHAVN